MKYYLSSILLLITSSVFAQDSIERMTAEEMKSFRADEIIWNDEPLLPKGAKSALIVGAPSKAGVFIAWLKFPANYPIPAHTHPFTEVITVLKGSLGNGMGEVFDKESGETLNVGESFVLPAGHAHYVWTNGEETIVELIATGPWDITYINPSDDPRK
ncbi:cupin domain-containing protein [Methylophaga sp. OBS3]|uniref:cupin domain-containing protein n=1 Tax=Methylophaga sp. OBS3 TaxID=2991934 RepID=UPI002253E125|nr:cupin domain-containing protein [Methylophaga sp. OBS3]MCX4189015.1 cupin domain-containing protein [Methylophaga sp. OBS3]